MAMKGSHSGVPLRLLRGGTRGPLQVLLALSLVAAGAYAAVVVNYNLASTGTLSLKPPPIVWVAGPDSSGNPFVASFFLSNNATYYNVTIKPVPEANVTWSNFTTLKNQDTTSYSVTVTGSSASGFSKVLDYKVEFHNWTGDTLIGTLDLRNASPSVTLGQMSPGVQWYTKVYIKLDTGTGAQDLPSTTTMTLSIT